MQDELNSEYPSLNISLIGVNEDGFSSGNSSINTVSTLPLINDNSTDQIWTTWGVTFRDVVILNEENQIVASFNLTTNSLSNSTNYDALKNMLITEATN
jgi:hypothetical protein